MARKWVVLYAFRSRDSCALQHTSSFELEMASERGKQATGDAAVEHSEVLLNAPELTVIPAVVPQCDWMLGYG